VSAPSARTGGARVERVPQARGAAARERVLDVHRAAQADHVVGGVVAGDPLPARVLCQKLSISRAVLRARRLRVSGERFPEVMHFGLLPIFVSLGSWCCHIRSG
jgi:hypothetical protein